MVYTGFNEKVLTFDCEGTVNAGDLVIIHSSGTVKKAPADSDFAGVCLSVEDGCAAVQVEGYVYCPKSGTINVGFQKISAAAGAVKANANGREHLVLVSDSTNVGFLL